MSTPETITFTATPYRISTITVTGGINTEVCLTKLYNVLALNTPEEFSYLEYGMNKHDLLSIGVKDGKPKRSKKTEKTKTTNKRFDNQLTIIMFYNGNKYNIKLFKNGNIQITGVKSIPNGKKAIDFLIEQIRHANVTYDSTILVNMSALMNSNYRIRLINSDFRVNFEIRLDYLYNIVTKKYGIICSYEPCIYPGAKIEYYYPNGGFCKCKAFCNGKTDVCKKITIAVFQSGCVIITGANKIDHIEVAYEFICKLLKENMLKIKRNKLKLPDSSSNVDTSNKKTITKNR